MNQVATISAAVPADVKAEAAAVAAAHGMSLAALVRELVARGACPRPQRGHRALKKARRLFFTLHT